METDKVVSLAEARAEEDRRNRLASIDAQLAKTDKLVILGTVSNLILIIGQDPILANLLGFNEFSNAAVIHAAPPVALDGAISAPGPYPRPWDDVDVAYIQSYIQRVWTRLANRETTDAAMHAVACMRRFHPVRDWLATLRWDGKPRLNRWMLQAFGAAATPYTEAVASKFLIAAVRRVRHPGCKFDHMPVLEGDQGIGKSTVIRKLFGDAWFTDSIPAKLESADAALCLQGVWCVEFAEIEQIIRAEVEIIKAFLSRDTDRFRAPYGRKFLAYPRQCVMIGTTNDSDYLRDSSGNRRFWPVACPSADAGWVTLHREQLWAEAAYREAQNEDHWLADEEVARTASNVQSDRMQDDPWEDRVEAFLAIRMVTTASEILHDCLNLPLAQQGRKEQMRVGSLLKRLGWLRNLHRDEGDGYKVKRRWVKGSQHA